MMALPPPRLPILTLPLDPLNHPQTVDRYCKFDEFDTFSNGGVPFEVKMCGNNKITTSQGSFTVYEMEVMERKGGGRKWQLAKRYSDFNDLHEVLSDAGYAVGEIKKALPPKRWFGNLEGDVIMFRQRALERYLTMCLQCASPDDCSAVMQFLNTSTIPVSRNPNKNGPLPITPPSQSIGSDLDMYNSTTSRSNSVDVGGSFEPRSMNDEERGEIGLEAKRQLVLLLTSLSPSLRSLPSTFEHAYAFQHGR